MDQKWFFKNLIFSYNIAGNHHTIVLISTKLSSISPQYPTLQPSHYTARYVTHTKKHNIFIFLTKYSCQFIYLLTFSITKHSQININWYSKCHRHRFHPLNYVATKALWQSILIHAYGIQSVTTVKKKIDEMINFIVC